MSDVTSTGISTVTSTYGKTCRKDVLCRINVPVVPGATVRARPVPRAETQFSKQMPTRTARFTRRIPAINNDQAPSSFSCLVFKHLPESTPAAIRDCFSQFTVTHHVFHSEIFKHDHVVITDQPGGSTMQKVGTGRTHFSMRAGDFYFRFHPVGRATLTARLPALIPGESLCSSSQLTWVSDLLTIGGDSEILNAQIHTNHSTSCGQLLRFSCIHGKRNIPAPARITGNYHRRRIDHCRINIRPRPHERQWHIHFSEEQLTATVPESRTSVLSRLTTSAGLIPRVPCTFQKKVSICNLLMPDHLLQRNRRNLIQPSQFFCAFHSSQVSISLGEICLHLLVMVPGVPPGEGPVPDSAYTPERTVQHAGLLRRRVRPALIRCPHTHYLI